MLSCVLNSPATRRRHEQTVLPTHLSRWRERERALAKANVTGGRAMSCILTGSHSGDAITGFTVTGTNRDRVLSAAALAESAPISVPPQQLSGVPSPQTLRR